jgi:hypothetical protein
MSTIPFFETRQEHEEVLLLIAEIVPQCRFPSELGLQVTDLNNQPFTFLIVLHFEFIELAVIAVKGELQRPSEEQRGGYARGADVLL